MPVGALVTPSSVIVPGRSSIGTGWPPPAMTPLLWPVMATRRWAPSSDIEKSFRSVPGTEPEPVCSRVARSKRWMPVAGPPATFHWGVAR